MLKPSICPTCFRGAVEDLVNLTGKFNLQLDSYIQREQQGQMPGTEGDDTEVRVRVHSWRFIVLVATRLLTATLYLVLYRAIRVPDILYRRELHF